MRSRLTSLARPFSGKTRCIQGSQIHEKNPIQVFLVRESGPLRPPAPRWFTCKVSIKFVSSDLSSEHMYGLHIAASSEHSFVQTVVRVFTHEKRRTTLRLWFTLLCQVYFIVVALICKCDNLRFVFYCQVVYIRYSVK